MSEPATRDRPSLFNDQTTSDVLVKFGIKHQLYAHKHILAAKSAYFRKAFTGGFSSTFADEIILTDEHNPENPEAIQAMIRHIYDLPFNDQERTPRTNLKQMDIAFHIDTFLAADEYDVPTLRDEVLYVFWKVMMMSWEVPSFFYEISNLCRLSTGDCRLRELAVSFCVKHASMLFEESSWAQQLLSQDPLFGRLFVAIVKENKQDVSWLANLSTPLRPSFRCIASHPERGIEHIIAELTTLDDHFWSKFKIARLLRELSAELRLRPDFKLDSMHHLRLFPVRDPDGSFRLSAADDSRWFIPDAPYLYQAFAELLPLLDVEIIDQESLEPLLVNMGTWNKRLSQNVSEQETIEGLDEAQQEQARTDLFQQKVRYLLCLVRPEKHDFIQPKLERIAFYSVKSISIMRKMIVDGQEVKAKVVPAGFSVGKDQKVYVVSEDLASNDVDYYELAEKLAPLCNFQTNHIQIAARILFLNKTSKIESMLSENHIYTEKGTPRYMPHQFVEYA